MELDETPRTWILLEAHIYGTVCDEASILIGENWRLLHTIICMSKATY